MSSDTFGTVTSIPVLVELTIRQRSGKAPPKFVLRERFATMADEAGRQVEVLRTLDGLQFTILLPPKSGWQDFTIDLLPVLDALVSSYFETVPEVTR